MARIHLLALPNAPTTNAYHLDGFSQMTIRIAQLLKGLGHSVALYGHEENEAPCDQLVPVISRKELAKFLGDNRYQDANIVADSPIWQLSNQRIIQAMQQLKKPQDMIWHIGGYSQKPVTDAHSDLMDVEYSIGYVGNYSRYRVFQSKAWQHYCYGAQGINKVRFFDKVIPAFFDVRQFPVVEPQPYVAYCGRIIPRKGLYMATRAAQEAGVPLKIIGHGGEQYFKQLLTYGEFLGPLDNEARNKVLAGASAVYCATTYIEPFNCVAVEAQLCGTPVISTDQGGFVETVEQGVSGFRCTNLGEFIQATKICTGQVEGMSLNRAAIRQRAESLYSMPVAAASYAEYIAHLESIWKDGWYTK